MLNPEKFKVRIPEKKEVEKEGAKGKVPDEVMEGKEGEKEKKEIRLIEKSPLDYQDKKDLLLAYFEEKPASWLGVDARFYKKEGEKKKAEILRELAERKEKVQELLEKLGFIYEKRDFEEEEQKTYDIGCHFLVSKNSENLFRLKKALEEKSDKEIGLSLGYPETAIEGFLNKEMLDYEKLRESLSNKELKELQKEGVFKFLTFHPSKDHWREELEVIRRYQKLIREKSPKIYKEIIQQAADPLTTK